MPLFGEEAVARLKRPRNAVARPFSKDAPDSVLSEAMSRQMRGKIFGQDASLMIPKEIVQSIFQCGPTVREVDEPMLWSTMRRLGVHAGRQQMKEIMTYFDIRVLARIDINEFLTEVLRVPLARSIPLHLVQGRKPLSGEAAALFTQFRNQCERLAVSGGRLRTVWDSYDQDGSGKLGYDEVKLMCDEFLIGQEGTNAAAKVRLPLPPASVLPGSDRY